jgi:hypothetical protein
LFFGDGAIINNWSQDYELELGNAANDDQRFLQRRVDYCEEFQQFFSKTCSDVLVNMEELLAKHTPARGDKS